MSPSRILAALAGAALALAGCEFKKSYDQRAIDEHRMLDGLTKDGFLFGAATAGYQVEGGLDGLSDWGEFGTRRHPILPTDTTHPKAGKPTVRGGAGAGLAADSWNKWPDDVAALERLGANAYRFGVEWARLEPVEGQWADPAVWDNYRALLAALKARGITPMLTVYHFTLPLWLRHRNDGDPTRGGWEYSGAPALAERFAAKLAQEFGEYVDLWVTVNEPNVMTTFGYLTGVWPPGYRDGRRMVDALTNLMRAHAKMAAALKANDRVDLDGDGRTALTGIAHHVRFFEPASWGVLDGVVGGLSDGYFNDTVLRANEDGLLHAFIPPGIDDHTPIDGMKGSYDFLGLNYYGRDYVRADLGDPSLSRQYVPADRPKSSLGWDLYPEGFERILVRMGAWGLPIYVTENGTSDFTGTDRSRFLRSHLYALDQARARGVDIRGYLHWSLVDNFEWAEGYDAPFGLFGVDWNDPTRARVPTCSVNTFQQAARNLGLTPGDPVAGCP
jgi:beta-glucosidase